MMEIRSHKGQPMLPYNGGKMALEEKPPDILENPEKKTSLDERDAFVRVYIRFVFLSIDVHRFFVVLELFYFKFILIANFKTFSVYILETC